MNFLIVEDNENMRRMIRSLLSEIAGEVHECCDGAEALSAYAAHRPDWVLMDLRMKDADGIEATGRITSAFPEARIMIVTDYDDQELRAAARSAGASEYLSKENLLDLSRILRAHASLQDARETAPIFSDTESSSPGDKPAPLAPDSRLHPDIRRELPNKS